MRHPVTPVRQRVVHLRVDTPAKPDSGQPCNGCGVCCAWAPCPAGMVLSGRRRGRCRALRWAGGRYRCGLVLAPGRLGQWLPTRWAQALARRWIGAGRGCDADLTIG